MSNPELKLEIYRELREVFEELDSYGDALLALDLLIIKCKEDIQKAQQQDEFDSALEGYDGDW